MLRNNRMALFALFVLFFIVYFFVIDPITTADSDMYTESTVVEETAVPTEESSYEEPIYEETEPVKELNNIPLIFNHIEYKAFYDIDLGNSHINEVNNYIQVLTTAIDSEDYTEAAESAMNDELVRLHDIVEAYKLDVLKYSTWESEYYYAAKTYEFFRQNGYSAEVACGIIGNMMIETSGGTLALNPTIYSPSGDFYGLCQWSLYYRPHIADVSFENQLLYLHGDIEGEFKTFGFCYKNNFTYADFLAMNDPGEAAIAFAKVYERCGSSTYNLRANCAKIAYDYFTGDE